MRIGGGTVLDGAGRVNGEVSSGLGDGTSANILKKFYGGGRGDRVKVFDGNDLRN